MDSDEIKKKLAEGKIEFSSQEGVESFPEAFVDEFLRDIVLVKGGAWISDRSTLDDFTRHVGARERITAKYGIDVGAEQNLLKIFRLVYAVNRTPQ